MKTQLNIHTKLAKTRKAATPYPSKPTKKLTLKRETIRVAGEGTTLKKGLTTRKTMQTSR